MELSSSEINAISALPTTVANGAFAEWLGVMTLYDVAATVSGTINMLAFPLTDIVTIANAHSGNYTDAGAISVTNAPGNFIFNFQDVQVADDFSIIGIGGLGDTATINYGTGYLSTDPVGAAGLTFTSQGIDNLDVNVFGASGFATTQNDVYLGGIVAVATAGGTETLTITSNVGLDLADTGSGEVPGHDTLTLFGGTFSVLPLPAHWSATGTLVLDGSAEYWLGVTNASTITDNSSAALNMNGPDDDILYGALAGTASASMTGDVVTADGSGSMLQGSTGTLAKDAQGLNWTGLTGSDSLTDTAGGSFFYGDGGPDSITMGDGGNTVYFGTTYFGIQHGQSITDIVSGNEVAQIGFWGNTTAPAAITKSTSADVTDISGFTVSGASHDVLDFNVQAWAGGGTGVAKLEAADRAAIAPGNAVVGIEVGPGDLVALGVDLVLYNVSGLTDASDLAAALAGPGAIGMGFTGGPHHNEHVLFAYQVCARGGSPPRKMPIPCGIRNIPLCGSHSASMSGRPIGSFRCKIEDRQI